MEYMEETSELLNTRWENDGRYLSASTGLSAAAAVLILWLAALLQQHELPTPNDQGG